MKQGGWLAAVVSLLFFASAGLYTMQLFVFHRAEDTFFYMVQDLAFLPVQVLLVTVILNEAFKRRERAAMQKKMNMAIGAFFSEAGRDLISLLSGFGGGPDFGDGLLISPAWTDADFARAIGLARGREFAVDSRRGDLGGLKEFLAGKRQFLLGLLENPNLLEHESFTELLWAVFHLAEELGHRDGLDGLPASDYEHLSGDIRRAYGYLISEWLSYARHLRGEYPYIYSLVVRINPFDAGASAVVK